MEKHVGQVRHIALKPVHDVVLCLRPLAALEERRPALVRPEVLRPARDLCREPRCAGVKAQRLERLVEQVDLVGRAQVRRVVVDLADWLVAVRHEKVCNCVVVVVKELPVLLHGRRTFLLVDLALDPVLLRQELCVLLRPLAFGGVQVEVRRHALDLRLSGLRVRAGLLRGLHLGQLRHGLLDRGLVRRLVDPLHGRLDVEGHVDVGTLGLVQALDLVALALELAHRVELPVHPAQSLRLVSRYRVEVVPVDLLAALVAEHLEHRALRRPVVEYEQGLLVKAARIAHQLQFVRQQLHGLVEQRVADRVLALQPQVLTEHALVDVQVGEVRHRVPPCRVRDVGVGVSPGRDVAREVLFERRRTPPALRLGDQLVGLVFRLGPLPHLLGRPVVRHAHVDLDADLV